MRYLITGGAGFIGSHLVDALTTRGDDVLVLDDLTTGRIDNLDQLDDRDRDRKGFADLTTRAKRFARINHSRVGALEFVEGSVTNEALVDDCMSSVDVCLHLASAVGVQLVVKRPLESMLRNVRGCDIVISAAARHGRRLLFTSTSEIYGKVNSDSLPESSDRVLGSPFQARWSYSTAKAFGEILAAGYHGQAGAETIVARLFNTVGPRQTGAYGMVLPTFVRQALDGQDLTVYGTGTQARCFTHVLDTVHALVLLCDADGANGNVYNVGTRTPVSVIELAGKVIERTGSDSHVKLVPYDEAYGPGFEELGRRVPDTSALEELTGWTPSRTIDEMIDDVIVYEQSEARRAREERAPESAERERRSVLRVAR
jgi:UDP-glucose 4-epimerase